MSRAIVGTKGLQEAAAVAKQSGGGLGSIRCPKCQGIASVATDTISGAKVNRCGGCGTQFSSTPL